MALQGWEMVPYCGGLEETDDGEDDTDNNGRAAEKELEELRDVDAWFRKEAAKAGVIGKKAAMLNRSLSCSMDAGEYAAASADMYGKMVQQLNVEEMARRHLSSNLGDLRRDMTELLSVRSRPIGGKRHASELQEDAEAMDRNRTAEEKRRPRLRPCACGCGALVRDGDPACEGNVTAMCAERLQTLETVNSPLSKVDLKAQRAAAQRLSQRREPAKQPEEPASHPRRPVDVERLKLLAQPREEKQPEELTVKEGRAPVMPRSQSVPGPRWGPHDLAQPRGRMPRDSPTSASAGCLLPSLDEIGGSLGSRAWSRVPSAPAPFGVKPPAPLAAAGLAALAGVRHSPVAASRSGARRRSLKLRPDADTPGLSRLLDRAALEDAMRGSRPSSREAARGGEMGTAPSFASVEIDDPPKKVRTQKAQQSYMEARLYKKPAEKPGSVAALQARLDQLRQERFDREAVAAS